MARQPCRSCLRRSELLETRLGISSSMFCPTLAGKPKSKTFCEVQSNIIWKSSTHKKLLTSKLICPPMEKVRLYCANFSRSTDTILGRML